MRARFHDRGNGLRRSALRVCRNRQGRIAQRMRSRIEEEQGIRLKASGDVDLPRQELFPGRGEHRDRDRPVGMLAQGVSQMGVVRAEAAAEHDKGEGSSPHLLEGVREIGVVLDGGELVLRRALGDEQGSRPGIALDRLSKLIEDRVEVGLPQLPGGA